MPEKVLKNHSVTLDPRLDRFAQFDDASRNHQIRELLEQRSSIKKLIRRHRSMKLGRTLDQGQEGACTAYSTGHAMQQRPFNNAPFLSTALHEMYFENQQRDEWPGGEYPGATPVYSGSSVLASMKTLKARGYIKEYRWIGAGSGRAIDDLVEAVRYIGPVCLGINWYESMEDVDQHGILHVDTSKVAGGHAICAVDALTLKLPGTAKRQQYVVLQNSWSPTWGAKFKGQGGFCYVTFEDVQKLLDNDGEGAVPLKG